MNTQLAGQKILIVDDDQDLLDLLAESLTAFGAIVFKASNGIQALKLINKNQLNFIFCDLKLPKMTGIELLAELKSSSNDVPDFYFFSGYSDKSEAELILLGAKGFLNKPFEIKDIINIASKKSA